MRTLVTGDIHLNNLPRDNYRHNFISKDLMGMIIDHKADHLVIVGDLTDEKNYHSAALVNRVVDHIYNLSLKCPITINMGNHDYSSELETPFFTFLRRIENVRWIGDPTHIGDFNFLFLPHTPAPEVDWHKGIWQQEPDWIFTHNTFSGTIGENGQKLDGPSIDIFPKGSRVISGDVHVPQTNGPVTYVGAPYTIDFGDKFEPRVLLINGNKLASIPCPGPRKRLVECTAGEKMKLKANPGDILKINVKLDKGQYARWEELKQGIEEWAAKYKFVIHRIHPIVDKSMTKGKVVKREAPKADPDILKGYAKKHALDDRTLNVGLEILKCT